MLLVVLVMVLWVLEVIPVSDETRYNKGRTLGDESSSDPYREIVFRVCVACGRVTNHKGVGPLQTFLTFKPL